MKPSRWALWSLAAAALAGAFSLYLRPAFMVTLADMVWSCF